MSEVHVHPVPKELAESAWIDRDGYEKMYKQSIEDPEGFWAEQAKRLDWFKPFSKVKNVNFTAPGITIKWFEDGVLNACYNCVDRHLDKRGDQPAIIWEGDEPDTDKTITYKQLHAHVAKLANAMKERGVK